MFMFASRERLSFMLALAKRIQSQQTPSSKGRTACVRLRYIQKQEVERAFYLRLRR
jgi:hypothetical protein